MKIACHVPIYGRRNVFERFLQMMPFEVWAAASTDMDFNFCVNSPRIHEAIKAVNRIDYKCQKMLDMMRKQSDAEAVLFMGCDDFMHPALYPRLPDLIAEYDFIGFQNIYFYTPAKNKVQLWPGYPQERRMGEPAGAGRIIRRDLLDKIEWNLWQYCTGSEDADSWATLQGQMENPLLLDCTQPGQTFVDIKDDASATKTSWFTYLHKITDNEIKNRIIQTIGGEY